MILIVIRMMRIKCALSLRMTGNEIRIYKSRPRLRIKECAPGPSCLTKAGASVMVSGSFGNSRSR